MSGQYTSVTIQVGTYETSGSRLRLERCKRQPSQQSEQLVRLLALSEERVQDAAQLGVVQRVVRVEVDGGGVGGVGHGADEVGELVGGCGALAELLGDRGETADELSVSKVMEVSVGVGETGCDDGAGPAACGIRVACGGPRSWLRCS